MDPPTQGARSSKAVRVGSELGPLSAKCRVLICDDHGIMRDALRALLESEHGFEIVAVADNGRDAVRQAALLQPDLVLMDLSMPHMDGLSALRELKKRCASTHVLVLTMHKTEGHIRAALRAGARGYVIKDGSRAELIMAVREVLRGKTFISPAVADCIITDREGRPGEIRSLADTLTPREKQVLKLIAEGRRNRDIAAFLFVSVKTVEKHRANLMSKLDLHNTAALAAFAIENKLLTP